jgi:hypothetical protein
MTRADIVARARRELGVKWQHQARLSGVALDCVGLVGVVAIACGVPNAEEWLADDDLKRYGRPPRPDVLLAGARKYLDEIPVADALEGDILVLAHKKHPATPTHFAQVTQVEPRYVIHAEYFAGRVVENNLPDGGRWFATHAFRFRGLA